MTTYPLEDPTCICGAQTTDAYTPCRKCRARSRWQRRAAHRDRARRHQFEL
jgi:hypothetical protein